ncbi:MULTISPECIES: SDR family NAD(P)-dependent oxidoreductase [Clostridium]|uniref:SDR family NAD(P)-dependent oxidoreductase n=1 Tax=Clostridium TaxID=1485 RepID=UPI0005FC2ECB|nr:MULTISPECIES: SDR family oxidoreductase [Clostridium]KJZ84177.1 Short-chain dehydrogenase/reductase SDR [Clostridium sp. IBUN125C]KJZ92145.1 Short-chain dehydrogenase/reductase SDR [Clostridium sp. IBUN22A]KJZ94104.1 hypothetical protein ClosIBUN13A_CONTIG192g03154 [Clostridium sp. IBUN13A]MBS4841558.1 SDR family oxidoreductase [Clostridium sp.]MDU1403392.1 SDR family oxidoreductase [Clostridium sp.]
MEYVLITGGTSGIGYELVKKFAANNYGIVIVSSNRLRLENTKKEIESKFGIPVLIYEEDLGQIGSACAIYDKIHEANINISVLVNNAGFGLLGCSDKISLVEDEKMMILNIISVVELCKLFLGDMYKQGKGKILNISSTGAFQPGPYTSTYFASKEFILSYSKAIRYEAKKKGVQVCILCPGATRTNFFIREGKKTPKSAMSPKKVAEYGYKRLMKNKEISIPGKLNRLMRLFPEKIKMKYVANMKK